MGDMNDHRAQVNAWLQRVVPDNHPGRLIQVFEQAFSAIWTRAYQTLGDVTLTAIADRVLYNAAAQFPPFSTLKMENDGLQCRALYQSVDTLPPEQLALGIRFVLTELLTVLGNLTAEILTPALHFELSKIAPRHSDSNDKDYRP